MVKVICFYPLSTRAKLIIALSLSLIVISASIAYVQATSRIKPIYEVKTNEKVLALTFDISWGTQTPTPVLDILEENQVKATFFLSGPWAQKYPEIPRRIANNGHEVASHGHRHINLSTLSPDEIKQEIMQAHNILQEVTGTSPKLIRTPNGDYADHVIMAANECGYQVIQWGTDSLDWKNPGIEAITNRVLTRAHPGDIILMHASDTCKQTVDALPAIINGLKEQGYRFVTVSELLTMGEWSR
ncbi:MAG: polysaccharide deacetylase family sporulation protein PdaB [Syntrophomonadaceae bacterium]|nr:polysaccharide deacetylase family sporulation protein PdaB [Syntrophomonadaceae bacterium]